MAPLPDAQHLLELLQRAADELKGSQRDTLAARAEVKSLQDQLAASERALVDERRVSAGVGQVTLPPGALKTTPFMKSPLARDEKTSVGGDDAGLMGERVQGLQDELTVLEDERRALKGQLGEAQAAREELGARVSSLEAERDEAAGRVASLEAELATPRESLESTRRQGELEHELSNTRQQLIVEQARGADLLTRLQAWEARSQDLEQSLIATRQTADDELAQLDQLAGQLSQVETELTTERARTQAQDEQLRSLEQGSSNEQMRLFEATSRIAQLEVEMAGLKGRRDELNVEIGKVENERNAARNRAAELEQAAQQVREQLTAEHRATLDAAHHQRSELELQLSREKEKHQITAQKLLEARGKQRELEDAVHRSHASHAELSAEVEALTSAHQLAVNETQRAHEASVRELHAQVGALTAQLETATTEWRHVERQYESLHREMLLILDQRDEARRELDGRR